MDQADKMFFRSLLLKSKEEVENTLQNMHDHGTGHPEEFSSGELSSYDNHPAELGTQVFNLGMNMSLKKHEKYQLTQIDNALEKLKNNKYGICEYCGKDIVRERLEAKPEVRLCIECEKNRDVTSEYIRKERPVEEDTSTQFYTEQNDTEYEGMDYWNDLLKYGSASSPQDMGGYKDYKEFYTNEVDKQGIVDPVDNISNEEYKKQLPD